MFSKMFKMLLLAGGLALLSQPTPAADLGGPTRRPSTIFDDGPSLKDQPQIKVPATTAFGYVGLTAGLGVAHVDLQDIQDSDHSWLAGGYAGWWIRPNGGMLGWGIEGDYVRQGFKFTNEEPCEECDPAIRHSSWTASARLRAGIYMTDNLIAYGTVGAAWTDIADPGPVWGGGLEYALNERVSVRAEVLRYDFQGRDADQTVGRGGITFRLN